MDTSPEKYCQALGCVFQTMMNEMKSSLPVWEEFATKCTKLHSALKMSLLAFSAFLDSFQKLADLSTNSKGGARAVGTSLTRLCMRQRTIEAKLRAICTSLVDQLANPVLERVEEWKRNTENIDKERTRDYKKARQEVKRASMDTLRMQKKVRKSSGAGMNAAMMGSTAISGNARSFSNTPMGTLPRDGSIVAQAQLELALQDVNARWGALQEAELSSVRKAMREERARFCFFVTCFKPIIDQQVSLLSEMACFQEIAEKLAQQSADVNTLPGECEQLLTDLRNSPELLLKSFSQSQSQSSLSLSQSQGSCAVSIDSVSVGSGCTSDAHSPSAGSSADSHSVCNSSGVVPNEAALTHADINNEVAPVIMRPPPTQVRRESIACIGSATLTRRASQKNMAAHYAPAGLHHCPTEASNLVHASVVSMSTNSLVSNASRSSCSSTGNGQPHALAHAVLPSLPKTALAGVPASSAASALLCVAAATRNAAAKATSQDSGFISQDTLYAACSGGKVIAPNTGAPPARDKRSTMQQQTEDGIIWMQKDDSPESALESFENYIGQVARQLGDMSDDLPPSRSDSPSHGSSASPVSTWTNWPEQPGYFDPKMINAQLQARPYTVSAPGASGSRKLYHSRPPLNDRTFEPPAALANDSADTAGSNERPETAPPQSRASFKVPPPLPTKCSSLHDHTPLYAAPCVAIGARNAIAGNGSENCMQQCLHEEDGECTLVKSGGTFDEDFPAPPSADVLQRIATECTQVTQNRALQRGDTVDSLPLPPPPSDYADPSRSRPPDSVSPPVQFGVVRSLASESSPISKLIQELGAKGDRQRSVDPYSEQPQYAAVSNGQAIYAGSEQVYAAPSNGSVRQSRPAEQSEYAQSNVRHSSRSRPAPPQRRSSVQITSSGVALPQGMSLALQMRAPYAQTSGTAPQAPARQPSVPDGSVNRERTNSMQIVSLPVDIQPPSGSLTSQAPLAVPIPAVRMSIGGIAACPPELTEHTGAILRQIKTGVSLKHCSSSLISDRSRPLLRF